MAEHPSDAPPPPVADRADLLTLLNRTIHQLPDRALRVRTSPCNRYELCLGPIAERWSLWVRTAADHRQVDVRGYPWNGSLERAAYEARHALVNWPVDFVPQSRKQAPPSWLPYLGPPLAEGATDTEDILRAILPGLVKGAK